MKNIFLRGKPGSGKTTLIIKIVKAQKNKTTGIYQSVYTTGGFYTQEIREGRDRVGFMVKTLDGKDGILSHKRLKSGPRVGKYRVNINCN